MTISLLFRFRHSDFSFENSKDNLKILKWFFLSSFFFQKKRRGATIIRNASSAEMTIRRKQKLIRKIYWTFILSREYKTTRMNYGNHNFLNEKFRKRYELFTFATWTGDFWRWTSANEPWKGALIFCHLFQYQKDQQYPWVNFPNPKRFCHLAH